MTLHSWGLSVNSPVQPLPPVLFILPPDWWYMLCNIYWIITLIFFSLNKKSLSGFDGYKLVLLRSTLTILEWTIIVVKLKKILMLNVKSKIAYSVFQLRTMSEMCPVCYWDRTQPAGSEGEDNNRWTNGTNPDITNLSIFYKMCPKQLILSKLLSMIETMSSIEFLMFFLHQWTYYRARNSRWPGGHWPPDFPNGHRVSEVSKTQWPSVIIEQKSTVIVFLKTLLRPHQYAPQIS